MCLFFLVSVFVDFDWGSCRVLTGNCYFFAFSDRPSDMDGVRQEVCVDDILCTLVRLVGGFL